MQEQFARNQPRSSGGPGVSGLLAVALPLALAAPLMAGAAAAGPGPAPRQGAAQLPHEELALEFLGSLGDGSLAQREPEQIDLDLLVQKELVSLRLGGFEAFFPPSMTADPEHHEDLQTIARVLLQSHRSWYAWIRPGKSPGPEIDAALGDVKVLESWIKKWKKKDLLNVEPGSDLGEVLPAKDAQREALENLNTFMGTGGPLPLAPGDAPGSAGGGTTGTVMGDDGWILPVARVVFVPDRRTFVSFCSATGYARPNHRSIYWGDTASWSEFRFDDTRVVALESADPVNWERGVRLDDDNPRGMEQQVVQFALGSLILSCFENRVDPDFAIALCANLVIDQFEEIDTRVDGDLRPRKAPPREKFVPGGLSQGGLLPKNDAESEWRRNHGVDHFAAVLKGRQKLGAGELKDKKNQRAFRIESDDGRRRFVAQAPFLGAEAANTKVPSEAFAGEWSELMRTYRICFVHWLREESSGKESEAKFAELLERLAQKGADGEAVIGFGAAFEEVYGMPLSGAEPGENDLEGRFLAWLPKAR